MASAATSQEPRPVENFIVASDAMRRFMSMVERVAKHVGTVLIVGETGTGKERIAHTIHEHSMRRNKPFVDINCAALPEHLVESELFGYEKGAFSGADTPKAGLFELANTGTIFLDEIGELDLKIQVKLLRVLDRSPYFRLGGHKKITADVRVVAATNRNLKDEVSAGRFRKDLYHRLSQFELCVPPLRERPEDVLALAEHFLTLGSSGYSFSSEALRLLESYSWPGNVREIQNVVNKVLVTSNGPEITAADLRTELSNDEGPVRPHSAATGIHGTLDGLEAQAIEQALQRTQGHRGKAAEHLGISRRTLSRKLRAYKFPSAQNPPFTLGVLGPDEQEDFRADASTPVVLIDQKGGRHSCTGVNFSARGIGVEGLTLALERQSNLNAQFALPDCKSTLEITGCVAWSDKQGRAGIRFTEVGNSAGIELRRWLLQRMTEEGWTLQSEPAVNSR